MKNEFVSNQTLDLASQQTGENSPDKEAAKARPNSDLQGLIKKN